jgi:hypothetical protein
MNKIGWRYIAAVVMAGVIFYVVPAKLVLAQQTCTTCDCLPPSDPRCQVGGGEGCSSDADCAGSATCNDEGLCQGGGGGGTTYQCPAGSTMVCPETTVICGVSANNQTYSCYVIASRRSCSWAAKQSLYCEGSLQPRETQSLSAHLKPILTELRP